MGTIKCSSITGTKQHLAGLGPGTESRFLETLPPDLRSTFKKMLPSSRCSIETHVALDEALGRFLFPKDSQAVQLHKLGVQMAHQDMSGVYKLLLKMTTVAFAIQQSGTLWKTYHDQGVTHVEEQPDKNHSYFIISDYADLPHNFRVFLAGWIQGLMEICGAKNISIKLLPETEPEVTYDVRWF